MAQMSTLQSQTKSEIPDPLLPPSTPATPASLGTSITEEFLEKFVKLSTGTRSEDEGEKAFVKPALKDYVDLPGKKWETSRDAFKATAISHGFTSEVNPWD